MPRVGWVNLHFSLLPAWRGAAPVQHAILHGDDITGASTFLIEQGLDTGPVFGVVTEAIRPDDTSGALLERLAASGAGLLVATMDGIEQGALDPRPQPADGVSFAGKITVPDAEVDWTTPAQHVDRLVRACTPAPGAWTTFRGERLKLGPVRVRESTASRPARWPSTSPASRSQRRAPPSNSGWSSRRASDRCRPPTGRAAPAWSRESELASGGRPGRRDGSDPTRTHGPPTHRAGRRSTCCVPWPPTARTPTWCCRRC